MTALINTKMYITKRFGSTVFDRRNFSVIDVTDLSEPIDVAYEPNDFFTLYEAIFNISVTGTVAQFTTSYSFLRTVSAYLQSTGDVHLAELKRSGHNMLDEFLVAPLVVYNDAYQGMDVSEPDNLGKTLALAEASYRVLSFI
jgi:hypothetical protein